ncbi:MAG: septum formation initiator family protein [Patescibacteria group bacterium]
MKNSWIRSIVILLSLILSVRAIITIIDLRARKYTVTERKNAVEQVKKENAMLQKELDAIHSDEYVEKIARDKLGMVKDDESIVLLPDEVKGGMRKEEKQARTNWQRWWGLFF